MLKKNITLYQVISVALAIFLWCYVALSQNPTIEKIYTLPVEFSTIDEKLVLLESNFQVQVRVQGLENVLDKMQTVDMKAIVDLTGLKAGEHELPVKIELADSVQLIAQNPEKITVMIEEKKTKPFTVSVEIGTPVLPAGYNAMEPIASPSIVYITGAEKYLKQIDKVFVGLNISGLSETYSQSLPVQVMDTQGNVITSNFIITPSAVDVIVPIVADLPEKSVAVSVDYIGKPAEDYMLTRIVVEPSTVSVYGELDILQNLLSVKTKTIDISGATADIIQTVDLVASEGVNFGNINKVTVIMQIMAMEEMQYENIPVTVINSADGNTVEVAGAVTVTVKGLATSLAKFNSQNLIASVDVGALKSGAYNLPVSVKFRYAPSADMSIQSFTPAEVRVTIAPSTNAKPSVKETK